MSGLDSAKALYLVELNHSFPTVVQIFQLGDDAILDKILNHPPSHGVLRGTSCQSWLTLLKIQMAPFYLWSNNLFKLPYFQYRLFRFPVRPEIGYDSL